MGHQLELPLECVEHVFGEWIHIAKYSSYRQCKLCSCTQVLAPIGITPDIMVRV